MFDLTALTAYTQENTDLLSSAVLNTKELEHMDRDWETFYFSFCF